MATVNLGRIKPIFKGAYSGSTAYVVDDIVTHGNETFICIQAHGAGAQATSQTAYWTKLAAKGTDGTDVGTTITTQGDILYRDGSGLQRLAKPASDMYLKNTSAGAVSWSALSSDFVKLAEINHTTGASSIELQQFITSTYKNYKLVFGNCYTANEQLYIQAMTGTNTAYTSSNYYYTGEGYYKRYVGGTNSSHDNFQGTPEARFVVSPGFNWYTDAGYAGSMTMDLFAEANHSLSAVGHYFTPRYTGSYLYKGSYGGVIVDTSQTWTGLKLYLSSGGNLNEMDIRIYGLKD